MPTSLRLIIEKEHENKIIPVNIITKKQNENNFKQSSLFILIKNVVIKYN